MLELKCQPLHRCDYGENNFAILGGGGMKMFTITEHFNPLLPAPFKQDMGKGNILETPIDRQDVGCKDTTWGIVC